MLEDWDPDGLFAVLGLYLLALLLAAGLFVYGLVWCT